MIFLDIISCVAAIVSAFAGYICAREAYKIRKTTSALKANINVNDAQAYISYLTDFEDFYKDFRNWFDNSITERQLKLLSGKCEDAIKTINNHRLSYSDEAQTKSLALKTELSAIIQFIDDYYEHDERNPEDEMKMLYEKHPVALVSEKIESVINSIRDSKHV